MRINDDKSRDFLSIGSMRASVDEFLEIYVNRPVQDNAGGMGLNHSWALWYLLRNIQPKLVAESGVWKGHSTWIIENASPNTQIYCFDISLKNLQYKSKNAVYFENDFTRFNWSEIDTQDGLCFFDDHQNVLNRVIQAKWFGFKDVIIEDNWPVNEGDCYSIRHMQAGVGFPNSQMSQMYRGSKLQRLKRYYFDKKLMSVYSDQNRLVKSNTVDYANLIRNTKYVSEINPVYLTTKNNWGFEYESHYQTKEPLLQSPPIPNADYSYSNITLVSL